MWEVQVTPGSLSTPLRGGFSVQYSTKCGDLENREIGTYRYYFDIADYQVIEMKYRERLIDVSFSLQLCDIT